MDALVEALRLMLKDSVEGDRALFDLCRAIIDRIMEAENVIVEQAQDIQKLNNRIDMLLEVIKTSVPESEGN